MELPTFFLENRPPVLPKYVKEIRDIVTLHAQEAARLLDVNWLVNVTIDFNKESAIPEVGAGGFTPRKDWMQISIDPTESMHKIEDIIKIGLPATVYHEMNHIARWGGVGYGSTLPEAIISEGLATVFEKRYWPEGNPLWGQMSENEREKCLKIFDTRDKSLDTSYNNAQWFFGAADMPRWLGYKLGTYIVEEALRLNPELDILALTKTPSDKIFQLANIAT